MNQDNATAREKLFKAAVELVSEGKTEKQITTREIARRAGINLALVNYYYQSKENLLGQVVGTMMGDIIARLSHYHNAVTDSRSRLLNMLLVTADAAFEYHSICSIAISAELKSGCINSCALVMPLLKEILPGFNETDLKIIALQLMVPFHHIVLTPEIYSVYLNTDFFDKEKRGEKIEQMVDCALSGQAREEKL